MTFRERLKRFVERHRSVNLTMYIESQHGYSKTRVIV